MFHNASRFLFVLTLVLAFSFTGVDPAVAAPPANDNFADAEMIMSLPFSTAVDNTEATVEPDEPTGCGVLFKSVWYSFTPAETMAIRLDMPVSLGGTVSVFLASGSTISDLTFVTCTSSGASTNFQVEAGNTYYLRVDSFGEAGVLQFNFEQIIPPANDSFASAEAIGALPFNAVVDNTNATIEAGEPSNCGLFRSVWYSFSPAEDMAVRVDIAGGAAGVYLASGTSLSDLTVVSCAFPGSSTNIQVEAGQSYFLSVDSFGQPAILELNLEQIFPPANDNFAGAETITSLPFAAGPDNTDATVEPGEPQGCSFPYRTVWYSFMPAEDMVIQVTSPANGAVNVFLATGPEITNLTSLICSFSGTSTNIQVEVGQTYYLQVDSFGQPGSIPFSLEQIFPPAHDSFASAQVISSLPFTAMVDNTNATAEPGEPFDCSSPFRSVWYSFIPAEDMALRVDTTGSQVGGAASVFLASGPSISDLTSVSCASSGNSSNFQVEAGQTYYLRVDSFGQPGILQLNLEQIFPPANDNFVDAETILSLPFSVSPDNSNATSEAGEPVGCVFPHTSLWYSFIPAEDFTVRVDMAGGQVGSAVDIFLASGPDFTDLSFLGCTPNGTSSNFRFEGGQTYYLRVDTFGQPGVLQLDLAEIVPPANDDFANPEPIPSVPFTVMADNTNATPEFGEPLGCGSLSRSLWYSFIPTETMTVKVNTAGSIASGNVSVFLATGPALSDLTFLTCAGSISVPFQVEAEQTYYLRLDSFGQGGALQLNLLEPAVPANDNFASAENVALLPFSTSVDIEDATSEPEEPQFCFFMNGTVWYSFTASETMLLRANTAGSSIGGNVNIYSSSGAGFAGLQFLNCSGPDGSPSFLVEAGQTYYLQAGSAFGQTGTINVNLRQAVPPSNDSFATAELIPNLPFNAAVDITDATSEIDEPQPCNFITNTIWYSFTAQATTTIRLDTQGSPINTNVNVYHAIGSGFPGLEFIQCANFGGATTFTVEAGETYLFQAGGIGQNGTVQFNLAEVPTLSGRVTDAVTGAPLPGNTEPFALVHLYRDCGEGCLEFVNSQQTDENGRFSFESYYYGIPLIPGEYEIEASAQFYVNRQFGPFTFNGSSLDVGDLPINPPAVIHGRLVDSESGAPLSGASIALLRCDENGCFEFVNSLNTGEDGLFRFDSYFSGVPLIGGSYELEVSAVLYETRRLEVTIDESETRDLGDVPVTPLPLIGSISGRLVEEVTGSPIPDAFLPMVDLYRCNEDFCEFVNSMAPDGEGRFRFETDFSGNRLLVGSYRIVAHADQYDQAETEVFPIGEDMHRTVGDIRLKSFPVRFSEVQFCDEIPASGGTCDFSVRASNGTDRVLNGRVWSMADSILPGSLVNFTQFQLGDPQHLKLDPGASATFRFRLNVPPNNSPEASSICTRVLVGEDTYALFNTIGLRHVFCVLRNGSDSQIVSPQEVLANDGLTADAAVSLTEIEPNNSCQTPQDMGAVMESTSVDGALDSGETADIDFYQFTGTPGMQLAVDHEGEPTGKGTLGDPLLGFFDSNCSLIALNDDSSSLNSHLDLTVPEDGVFILAATAFPDFAFTGGGVGSYQLTVTPLVPIGSISGKVVDAVSGAPLPGDAAPFAHVRLLRCGVFGCFDVNFQDAGSDGSFRFESDFTGTPLLSGEYMIIASADQYRFTQTDIFTVAGHEDYDTGNLALSSYPLRFSDIQACTIASQGGLCYFTVKVTNGLATRFTGRAWSIIEGFNLGTFVDYTTFQTDTAREIRLDPGKSMVLRFRFPVRGAVPDGAIVCATAFAGQNPGPLFNTVGLRFLFCFEKGSQGFTLMTEEQMQVQMQRKLIQEAFPTQTSHPLGK